MRNRIERAAKCRVVVGLTNDTVTVIYIVIIEMLPFVCGHDVEVMLLIEVLIILRVRGKEEVIFVLLLYTFPTVIVVGSTIRRVICTLLAIGVVSTKIGVQTQVLESVNLIVCFQVADERTRIGIVLLLHQRCKRVMRGLCIRSVRPGIVVVVGRTNGLIVTSEEPTFAQKK